MQKTNIIISCIALVLFSLSCGENIIGTSIPDSEHAENSLCANTECPPHFECNHGTLTEFSAGICQIDSANQPVCFYPEGKQTACSNGCDNNQCAALLDSCEDVVCPKKTECTDNHKITLAGTCEQNAQNRAECVYQAIGSGEDCPYGCEGNVCAEAQSLCVGVVCNPVPETECTDGIIKYFYGFCAIDGAGRPYCAYRVAHETACEYGCDGNICANASSNPCAGHCGNGIQDCGELGVDCGGECTPCIDPCADHCSNGVQDCGEQGIDCGGECVQCVDPCANHCSNGVQDCGEQGVDCGAGCVSCEPAEGQVFCGGTEKAIVLIDARLYAETRADLRAYLLAACTRRGFGIRLMVVSGLDDLHFTQVRELLVQYKRTYVHMEGVLFIGNIDVPTFFMHRADLPSVKYWPRYYQDLDMQVLKTIEDGQILDTCLDGPSSPEGFPNGWPCIAPGSWFYSAPYEVPSHDFDDFRQGSHFGHELWAAFLPVGYEENSRNNYPAWGAQLSHFFAKAENNHKQPNIAAPNFYLVGNDLNDIAHLQPTWDVIGPQAMDYYSINTLGEGQCIGNPGCYQRAPLENYSSIQSFVDYATTLPWMAEGWQNPDIFLSHMNSQNAFPRKIVFWNVHSSATHSIISSDQARFSIQPGKGGVLGLLSGCLVGTFQLPGRPLPRDLWEVPKPENNILFSLVTGNGAFVAALGSIPPRSMDDAYYVIINGMYADPNAYLGMMDKNRLDFSDQNHNLPYVQRQHWDILIGDPFLDNG